ncbi:MAG: glycosyltransferase family 2 protein [Spirochaetaceae bacterium]|nr:glycosyltransferase family 2 protein [Spirochaetaceae bacterium]HPE88171.1 glycosyltransferase [Spirochaetales bacterium]
MTASLELLLTILAAVALLDLASVLGVMLVKRARRAAYRDDQALKASFRRALLDHDGGALAALARADPDAFAAAARLSFEACSGDDAGRELVAAALDLSGAVRRAIAKCGSAARYERLRAYLLLGAVPSPASTEALLARVVIERDRFARLVLLRQLAMSGAYLDMARFLEAIESVPGGLGPDELAMLEPLSLGLSEHFASGAPRRSDQALRLFMMAVRVKPTEAAWDELAPVALERDDELGDLAAETLAAAFPPSWFMDRFGGRPERRFMSPIARSLGGSLKPSEAALLDPWFERGDLRDDGIRAVAEIDRRFPEGAVALVDAIADGPGYRAEAVSLALEHRLRFIAFHAQSADGEPNPGLVRMLDRLLSLDRCGSILSMLESPLPEAALEAIASRVRSSLEGLPRQRAFFARNGGDATRARLGVGSSGVEEDRPRIPVRLADKLLVAALVALALAIVPAAFALRWGDALSYLSAQEKLYRFVLEFHRMFAWYTLTINAVYLALLAMSAVKLRSQSLLWETGFKRFLFSSGLLPPVTVVAPAFNEERSIVDSVESLLALAYPRVQVVVVNDGSTDGTLEALERGFSLEPAAAGAEAALVCMPVRTVYRSARAPGLLVVDKVNGGKADALNAGLNYADGDYVCCIDADSVLDSQSLLRAMLQVAASDREVVAIGGNIFPVNGSEVYHGHLQRIGLPREPLAAFQTIEYMRSFVSGRLGWSLIDGLMIISGAFGLFRRDRVLEAGGYMTGKGAYRKDTVGEDMELVVRLARLERESGRRGTIDYCYNANCWTEVPEDGASLRKQRDRWHRGLVEVLMHHRGMVLRPRYGVGGLVSMPYFFLFELIGPWLEGLGYVMLFLSLALSLIDPIVSLTIFALALSLGILVSLCSVLLAERQILYFNKKDFFRLLALSVLENFGFRQAMSLQRIPALVQFFVKSKGWQKLARKGFSRSEGSTGGGA